MDSPVQIPFKSFIQLNASDATPIYLQLVFQFIKAIQLGLLPQGTKLPGSRILCKVLMVNRNTLVKAFDDLESQGFIEVFPNKGTFILSNQKQVPDQNMFREQQSTASRKIGFSFKQSVILDNPEEKSTMSLQLDDGLPDARLNYTDILGRLYVSKLKRNKIRQAIGYTQALIHSNFKKQFSNYLNLTRGLKIHESNLLTTTNHEVALFLALKLLISKGDKVVIVAPGFYQTNMSILDSGAEIISVPVDGDGIDTGALRRICEVQKIRALYLTSVFHYPTNIAISAKKRIEILELASFYDFLIIEDDYEFEFHFDHNIILPLAAISTNENVVYIGSFAKSLPPGFGYGFVSGPVTFIKELEKHQMLLEPKADLLKEQVLTEWLQEGEFHRLSKKNKKIYKQRRDEFIFLLDKYLNGKIKFSVPGRGLAVWIEWLDRFSLIKFKKQCEKHQLFLPHTILYQNKNLTATRIGFGNLDEKEMPLTIKILAQSLHNII